MKKTLTLFLALSLSLIALAQEKITEGIMTTKQMITSDNEQMSAMFSSIGEMKGTTYFKNTKSRAEVSNPLTGDVTIIADADTQQMLMLMNSQYGKIYTEQSTALTEEMSNSIKVEEGTETKTILGYECKEHTVTMKAEGQEVKMILYVTDKIAPIITQQTAMLGDKIKGFPMHIVMEMNQQGANMKITTEITELKKETVSDDKFDMTPPEGYTKQ